MNLNWFPYPGICATSCCTICSFALLPLLFKGTIERDDSKTSRNGWDREEQIRKNQPAMKLLKEHIDRLKKEQPTPEKEAAFEEFKKIIDAERPAGQKLYKNK
jgi:hypothetical protein